MVDQNLTIQQKNKQTNKKTNNMSSPLLHQPPYLKSVTRSSPTTYFPSNLTLSNWPHHAYGPMYIDYNSITTTPTYLTYVTLPDDTSSPTTTTAQLLLITAIKSRLRTATVILPF